MQTLPQRQHGGAVGRHNRWDGQDVVLYINYVRSGGSAVLSYWGIGADWNIAFLRAKSPQVVFRIHCTCHCETAARAVRQRLGHSIRELVCSALMKRKLSPHLIRLAA
jgi:hypothetical protein